MSRSTPWTRWPWRSRSVLRCPSRHAASWAVYRPLLEPMGLTHPQYLVMLALWQHAPLSVRELSALLQLDPGTLSPLLKRLEAIGYLRRSRDPADERNLAITLTPTGKALRSRAEEIPPA